MRQPPPTHQRFFFFNQWQCASVGASGKGGKACTQPCRADGDHIKIFKPNALALDRGLDVARVVQHSKE